MANDIPVPAFRSFRTAAGVHDAILGEVRRFVFSNGATARHPARSLRRRCAAEIATEDEIDVGRVFREHLNIFAIRVKFGPRRQGGLVHADGVIADGWHQDGNNSQAIR